MADIQSPFITGNEIDAYQGNAALGGGAGGAYLFNPANTDPLAQVNSTMQALHNQAFQAQQQKDQQAYSTMERLRDYDHQDKVMKYQQDIKDRDSRYVMFSGLNTSSANLKDLDGNNQSIPFLPDDFKYINDKTDTLRKIAVAKPGNYQDDPDFQKGMGEYNQLKNLASSRAVEYKNQQIQYANAKQTGNEDEAQRIKDNMATEFDNTPISAMKPVDPHLAATSTDWAKVHSKDYLSDKELQDQFTINGQDMVGVKASERDIRGLMRPGTSYYDNMFGKGGGAIPLLISKDGTNLDLAKGDNAKAAQYNTQWGYQPGDPHYMPPPFTITPEGKIVPQSADNLAYFVASEHILPSEDANSESDAADLANTQAKTYRILHPVAKGATGKLTAAELHEQSMRDNFHAAYNMANAAFTPPAVTKAAGTPAVSAFGGDRILSNVGNVNITKELKDKSLNPKDWQVYTVPGNVKYTQFVGEEEVDKNKKGTGITKEPDYTVALKNTTTGDVRLAFFKKDANPKDTTPHLIAMVDKKQALENYANHTAKYNKSDKNLSNQISFNNDAFDQAEKNGGATPMASGAYQKTKTIGGSTYGQDANGKWYKI